jgi:hypothetical protein
MALYYESTLVTLVTGYYFAADSNGDVYSVNPVTGLVGSIVASCYV